MIVTDDQYGAAAKLAQHRRWQAVSLEQILSMPTQLIGSREQIVDGLLALARSEGQRPAREEIDLAAVVFDRHAAWLPFAEERGVALEYELTQYWFLARLLQIAPVSREMVLNYVAEHTLGLPRSY